MRWGRDAMAARSGVLPLTGLLVARPTHPDGEQAHSASMVQSRSHAPMYAVSSPSAPSHAVSGMEAARMALQACLRSTSQRPGPGHRASVKKTNFTPRQCAADAIGCSAPTRLGTHSSMAPMSGLKLAIIEMSEWSRQYPRRSLLWSVFATVPSRRFAYSLQPSDDVLIASAVANEGKKSAFLPKGCTTPGAFYCLPASHVIMLAYC